MKKKKLKVGNIVIAFIIVTLIVGGIVLGINIYISFKNKPIIMIDLESSTLEEVKKYANENELILQVDEEYSDFVSINKVLNQSISKGSEFHKGDSLAIIISKGPIPIDMYEEYGVNELGKIPVMMYHQIVDIPSSETKYTGGNVDRDGYNRTAEAFRNDLEFYYNEGYRMISLKDYVAGNIDLPLGKSPIVLTFDDGNANNILVTGIDDKGNIIIDPNSAVGILEEFKKKYPDYNVTATFFLNDELFNQKNYNEPIIHWLIDNGYDIGNHSLTHADFSKISLEKTNREIGGMYTKLESIIPSKYVKIVALPYGSPYKKEHENFQGILSGVYDSLKYETDAVLRVGWMPESSPYSTSFDKEFIKRCRAYDNNGVEFDITMVFKNLKNTKYVSDGNNKTIVTYEDNASYVIKTDKKIILY